MVKEPCIAYFLEPVVCMAASDVEANHIEAFLVGSECRTLKLFVCDNCLFEIHNAECIKFRTTRGIEPRAILATSVIQYCRALRRCYSC